MGRQAEDWTLQAKRSGHYLWHYFVLLFFSGTHNFPKEGPSLGSKNLQGLLSQKNIIIIICSVTTRVIIIDPGSFNNDLFFKKGQY